MLESLSGIASSLANLGRSLGDVARGLTERETWERVVLVILGIVLVLIAVWPR